MKQYPSNTSARQRQSYNQYYMRKVLADFGVLTIFPRFVRRFAAELCMFALAVCLAVFCSACTTYKGGKVVDGTNLAIGMRIPGTDWNFNVLDYIGGMRVGADKGCRLTVTNSVSETNSYFGVVETRRTSTLTAAIDPETSDR